MKRYLRSCKLRLRASAAALALILALVSGGSAHAETTFQNFNTWQQSGFRGFGISGAMSEQAWVDLESTGANVVRVFVDLQLQAGADRWVMPSSAYPMMDQIIAQANRRRIKIVVTFGTKPVAPDLTYWASPGQQDSIVSILGQFAARYAGESAFAGFDILNEPYPSNVFPPSIRDATWNIFATRIIKAIRAQDPTRVIVYEFPRWSGNYKDLQPIPFDGVVYSSHWYWPHDLTHQGIAGRTEVVSYPVPTSHKVGLVNRTVLKQKLQPLRDFHLRYNVPIYYGEFSCARYAPGNSAYKFVTDVASIFEEFNFSWTYHSFRGYPAWDAELARGRKTDIRSMNTDLMRYLKNQMLTLNR